MTDEEKKERRAARHAAIEAKEVAEINALWERIPFSKKTTIIYITGRIAHEQDAAEIKTLRETRAVHFGPIKRRIQREASCNQESST